MSKPKKYPNGLQFVIQDLGNIDPMKFDKTGEPVGLHFIIEEKVILFHLPQNHEFTDEYDYEIASNSDGYVSTYLTEQEVDILIGDQFNKTESKEINNEDDKPRVFTTIELLQEAQKEENQSKEIAMVDYIGDYKFFIKDNFVWRIDKNTREKVAPYTPIDVFSHMSHKWYFILEEEVSYHEAMKYILDGYKVIYEFLNDEGEVIKRKLIKSPTINITLTPESFFKTKWYVIKQN